MPPTEEAPTTAPQATVELPVVPTVEPRIVNLTPHEIALVGSDGEVAIRIPKPSAETAIPRIATNRLEADRAGKVGVFITTYGKAEELPPPQAGVYLIVSGLLASALPERTDLLAPGELVRDADGKPVGAKGVSAHKNADHAAIARALAALLPPAPADPTPPPPPAPQATVETPIVPPTAQNVWALGIEIGAISVTEIAIKDYSVIGFTMGNYKKTVTVPVTAKTEEVSDGEKKKRQVVLRASLGTTQSSRPKLIPANSNEDSLLLLLEAHWGYRGSGEWLIVTSSPFSFDGKERTRLSLFHVMHNVELQDSLGVKVIAFAQEDASARGALGSGNTYLVKVPKNFQHRLVLKRTGRLYGSREEIAYAVGSGTPVEIAAGEK